MSDKAHRERWLPDLVCVCCSKTICVREGSIDVTDIEASSQKSLLKRVSFCVDIGDLGEFR